MTQLINEVQPVARKEHRCMACDWVFAMLDEVWADLTFTEKKALVRARAAREKILKGQVYVRQFVKNGDDVPYTFRAIPEVHAICLRLDLYCE